MQLVTQKPSLYTEDSKTFKFNNNSSNYKLEELLTVSERICILHQINRKWYEALSVEIQCMQNSSEVSYVPNIHKSIESLYFDPSYFGVDVEVL